jgi:DNA-binding CsgD family transcriptional regulator
MKRALLLLAIALCLAAVVIAAPDFSGTWVLNAEKTAAANPQAAGGGGGGRGGGMGGGEMTIKMTATEMTISRTMGQNVQETKYILDGKENTVNTGRGDLKYKATWGGDVLTIAGTQSSTRSDSPYKAEYSLSADGKTLTVANTRQGQSGEMVTKQIYDKK